MQTRVVQITVPETGVYNITIGLANDRSANDVSDTLSVYNGNYSAEATPIYQITDTRYNTYRGSSNTHNYVSLTEGDKLTLYTGGGNLGADYILLEKATAPASAGAVSAPTTYDEFSDATVKSYTFDATPALVGGAYQALTSVTVTVKVDGYDDKSLTKTAEDFGTISGPATFAILIGGDVTPTDIIVAVD